MQKILIVRRKEDIPYHVNSLPVPLQPGEKVLVLEDDGGQYITVKHNGGKATSVFSRHYFENQKSNKTK